MFLPDDQHWIRKFHVWLNFLDAHQHTSSALKTIIEKEKYNIVSSLTYNFLGIKTF